jgi:dTDP-4-amino-4,6-dideoxygalactose transaminase
VGVIPLSRPPVDDEIRQAVLAVLDSRQYILGPECRSFEAELAAYVGVRHAVLTSSATAGLWLTLRAFGVKAGDEILVPAHTAFPTIEAIVAADATPVFVDVDGHHGFDCVDAAAKATPRTVGLLPVHLYGQPVDLDAARQLSDRLGVWLLEDCAQAHGAAWHGRRVGGFGRAGVFSFYPSKNLTVMGDGGCVTTDDDEIAARCRRLRDHGRLGKDVHSEIGFNLRFNEIQAAVGRVLLRRLEAMNERRRALAARYARALAGVPLELPAERAGARHVYHLYVVRTARRMELASFLKSRDIETGVHYPVASHRQPAVERFVGSPLPATERLVDEILSLPISAGHTEDEIDTVATAVREFFGAR